MSQSSRRLLNYTLLREIGRGGMATVWYAENSVGRKFAIKLLKPELVAEESSVAERFRNEAQIMVRLEHPAILRVEDFYEDGTTLAIIMEYLAGHDLNGHIRQRGAIPEEHAVDWFKRILDAFTYVHQKGYFHRDVKPSNLFLTDAEMIKVMDFGIAKIVGTDLSLTQTDMLMGSPLYMSPEQILSPKLVDFRTDIYSLGVTLHALLSGQKPYDDAEHSMFSIQTEIVQKPLTRLAHVSDAVNDAIQQATQKKPADRFANCDEFARALTARPTPLPSDDEIVVRTSAPRPKTAVTLTDDATVLQSRNGIAPKPAALTDDSTVLQPRQSLKPTSPAPKPVTAPISAPVNQEPVSGTPTKSRLPLIAAGIVGLLIIGAGGWFALSPKAAPLTLTATPAAEQRKATEVAPPDEGLDAAKTDLNRAISFYNEQRYDSALVLLNRHRDSPVLAQNAEAQTDLGVIHYYGSPKHRVPQDLVQAEQWLQKGVAGKIPKAYYFLGLLKDGADFSTTAKSVARGRSAEAVGLYKTGANLGDSYAQATVGELFLLKNQYLTDMDACTVLTYLKQASAQDIMGAAKNYTMLKTSGRCPQ